MNTSELAAGWAVPAEQLDWDRNEWVDAFEGDAYAVSVMWAADDLGLLLPADLDRLLEHHGFTHFEYGQEWARGALQGLRVLPIQHAAQALAWLGY